LKQAKTNPSKNPHLQKFPLVVLLSPDEIKRYGVPPFGPVEDCQIHKICSSFGDFGTDWAYDTYHQRLYLQSKEQLLILKLKLEI